MGGKPRPEKKYQLVILNFGYVESSSLAKVFFICNAGFFPTKEEAVSHLALSLLSVYLKEQEQYIKVERSGCCKEAAKNDEFDFCPKCRSALKVIYGFEGFQGWIEGFPKEIADSFPDTDDWIHWWPWVSWKEILDFSDRAVEIEDSADQVLPAMIDIDKIDECKEGLGSLDLDAIKKAWKEWSSVIDFKYLKGKVK